MSTMYIGANDVQEVESILGDMEMMGYLERYDPDTIKEVHYNREVDYNEAYIRNYGNIQNVYSLWGFYGRTIYAVEVDG